MKGLHHHENYPQIVEIRFSRKFQGTILGPNNFSAGVLSKMALITKMSVRYAKNFTSQIKNKSSREAYLSVIENIRRVLAF